MGVTHLPSSTVVPHDHVVHFYAGDAELMGDVTRFLVKGLGEGGSAVLIATPACREGISAGLIGAGVDLPELAAAGRFFALDASESLDLFMVGGRPDPERFRATIGAVIATAAGSGSGVVHAFGEMVAVLWEQGNVSAAVELEDLWNDLARELDFHLYCAYPITSIEDRDDLGSATAVCALHTDVIAPRSYLDRGGSLPADGSSRSKLFIAAPSAATAARSFVNEALGIWGLEEMSPDASIVISELAANAIVHAGSAFRVSVSRDEDALRIGVEDTSASPAARREHAVDGTGGLGMALVERLSSRMGMDVRGSGKTVWATLSFSS